MHLFRFKRPTGKGAGVPNPPNTSLDRSESPPQDPPADGNNAGLNPSYSGFDPLGLTSDDTNLRELKNGRLAMMCMLGLELQKHVNDDQTSVQAENGNTGCDSGAGGETAGTGEIRDGAEKRRVGASREEPTTLSTMTMPAGIADCTGAGAGGPGSAAGAARNMVAEEATYPVRSPDSANRNFNSAENLHFPALKSS